MSFIFIQDDAEIEYLGIRFLSLHNAQGVKPPPLPPPKKKECLSKPKKLILAVVYTLYGASCFTLNWRKVNFMLNYWYDCETS